MKFASHEANLGWVGPFSISYSSLFRPPYGMSPDMTEILFDWDIKLKSMNHSFDQLINQLIHLSLNFEHILGNIAPYDIFYMAIYVTLTWT